MEGNENVLTADLHAMNRDRFKRGKAECLASLHVKSSAVTRALDHRAFEFPFGEGTAIVGANIVDRVNATVDIK